MLLSKEQVEHLASLACLTLSTSDIELLSAESALVIDYFHRIDAFPGSSELSARPESGPGCQLRPDEVLPSLERIRALAGATEHDGEYFRVPGVRPR